MAAGRCVARHDRDRQRRAGRLKRRRYQAVEVRFDDRSAERQPSRWRDPATRARLPDRPRLGVVRIQRRYRRLVRSGRAERHAGRHVPLFAPLDENGGFGETRMPFAGSLVLDRIAVAQCAFVPFDEVLEGEQHLAEFGIDVFAAVTTDQRGMSRPEGLRCDVGAVEGQPMKGASNEEVGAWKVACCWRSSCSRLGRVPR